MDDDFLSGMLCRFYKKGFPVITAVRGHIDMNDIIAWKLYAKETKRLCRLPQLAELTAFHHGSDIAQVNLSIQPGFIIIVYYAGDSPMDASVRPDHQHFQFFLIFHYFDPRPAITTQMVRNSIFTSRVRDQLSIYSKSYFTTSSKFSTWLRPLTCQSPVSPGVMLIRLL